MNLSQAIDAYCLALTANRRSPLTIAAYRRDLLGLARHAGPDLDVALLSPLVVQAWLASPSVLLGRDGVCRSDCTINRCKAATRSFGAWLAATGVAPSSPATTIEVRRVQRTSPPTLADVERKRLLREVHARHGFAAHRDATMLEMLLGTGLRLAELVGLDLQDIDLDQKRMTVHVKGGRTETRFLPTDLRRILQAYMRQRRARPCDTDALFLSNRYTRISDRQVQTRFHQWLAWAGVDRPGLTVHSTRHTFGTRLYERTHDLVLVGKALGHRTAEATRIYVHENQAALEDALERM